MLSLFSLFLSFIVSKQIPLYRDPTAPINDRVQDLMDRMTVEEIVGQLHQVDGHFDFITPMQTQNPGSLFSLLSFTAGHVIQLARETRLGIPVLMGIDAIHGHAFWPGATVFPTQLGAAQSWDDKIIEQMGNITAFEMRYTGPAWAFSPVLCISRDPRWGRIGETFGEDPYVIGRLAKALINGLQGNNGQGVTSDPDHVAACAKHFAGYSETEGGEDASEADLSFRKMNSFFLPPFEKVARETNVATFMAGYQAIEGVPMTLNKLYLKEVLRERYGYNGFVVSDYNNIGYLISNQKVVSNYEEGAKKALEAGLDMSMAVPDFYQALLNDVGNKTIDMKIVNESCRRILELKFKLGLFEDDRYPNVTLANQRNGSPYNRNQALIASRESVVLVKNGKKKGSDQPFLPLNENELTNIAVIGPNADNPLSQNGDWSLGTGQIDFFGQHPRNCSITYVDGITRRFLHNETFINNNLKSNRIRNSEKTVRYEMGCGIEPSETADLEAALTAVKESDVSVVVIGDRLIYYGEMRPTATLELMGGQLEMLRKIIETGKEFVLVVMSYKPVIIPDDILEAASAVFIQFSPGMLGGQALADLLFGDYSPSGRLTISIPRHAGQLPVFYNKIRSAHQNNYADFTSKPLFAFGYGLGYSDIEYVSASLKKGNSPYEGIKYSKFSSPSYKKNCKRRNVLDFSFNDVIDVVVTLKNNGKFRQAEVVQTYIHDNFTSATWSDIELKGYERVELEPGEQKEITISIPVSECSIVNAKGERVVEPGDFQVRVGKASDNILFNLDFTVSDE